jgi:hypothetical protein
MCGLSKKGAENFQRFHCSLSVAISCLLKSAALMQADRSAKRSRFIALATIDFNLNIVHTIFSPLISTHFERASWASRAAIRALRAMPARLPRLGSPG